MERGIPVLTLDEVLSLPEGLDFKSVEEEAKRADEERARQEDEHFFARLANLQKALHPEIATKQPIIND